MADYVSALNGQQMNEALMDVALHNSEAWAVGTRNGVNVTSADETYHNNAKYYAQVAQSAIPGTYTAAVRWDIAQGLAGESQEQARANISAGASNRNLLDNPFFTVNQREFTSQTASAATLCVDRWYIARCTASLSGNTISITKTSGQNNCYLSQHIDKTFINGLVGKTVTLSAIIDGTLRALTGVVKSNGDFNGVVTSGITFALENHVAGYGEFVIYISDTAAHTISCTKLETGSYSTLANDVPPDYWEELRKCRRYFVRLAPYQTGVALIGRAASATLATFLLGSEPMAKQTGITATITGSVYVRAGSETNHSVTAISAQTNVGSGVLLNVTSDGLTVSSAASIVFASGGKIDINGDL